MMMGKMCNVHTISAWLLWIGGINWGLVGIGYFMGSDLNVVKLILGAWPQVEAIVYVLVGVSAVMMLTKGKCKMCMVAGEKKMM